MALKFFGLGTAAAAEEEKNTVRALPATWYTSEEMYQLERRAIFSKRWLLTTHKNRLKDSGNWLRYEIAGFDIVLVRDRTGSINGFHNVCRHRAYTVVEAEKGNNMMFNCRYHGWSYGLNGKLAKAPGYQDMPNFDRAQNSLFPIHVHIDANGFIWINLDAKKQPEVAWEDDFKGGDTQARFSIYNFDDYEYDHTWDIDADYNWKLAVDNYNECYHCKTTHPDIPDVVDLASYSVDVQGAWLHHNGSTERKTTAEQDSQGLTVCSSYYWPNTSMNVSPHFMFTQRFEPRGPGKTHIVYEVYKNKNSSDELFKLINEKYKRVMTEDKALCNAAQKNIERGVFVNGELHPEMEKGPLFCQQLFRKAVTEHLKREEATKTEIWPAKQSLPANASASMDDIKVCSGLSCQPQETVAW